MLWLNLKKKNRQRRECLQETLDTTIGMEKQGVGAKDNIF